MIDRGYWQGLGVATQVYVPCKYVEGETLATNPADIKAGLERQYESELAELSPADRAAAIEAMFEGYEDGAPRVPPSYDGAMKQSDLEALVLARIDEIGAAEVARRVAPLWGYELPKTAGERISRWRAGDRDMPSRAFLALLIACDRTISPVQHTATEKLAVVRAMIKVYTAALAAAATAYKAAIGGDPGAFDRARDRKDVLDAALTMLDGAAARIAKGGEHGLPADSDVARDFEDRLRGRKPIDAPSPI